MDVTEQLRAWGAARAQALAAERSAQQADATARSADLQREAKTLRDRADRLHRDIYRSLDRPSRELKD